MKYRKFLIDSRKKYLSPLGRFPNLTDDQQLWLDTVWSMCVEGLDFFIHYTSFKILFIIETYQYDINEATQKELQWLEDKQGSLLYEEKKRIKFYIINRFGLLREVDPCVFEWFKNKSLLRFARYSPDFVSYIQW